MELSSHHLWSGLFGPRLDQSVVMLSWDRGAVFEGFLVVSLPAASDRPGKQEDVVRRC